jgi:hypothetical protein
MEAFLMVALGLCSVAALLFGPSIATFITERRRRMRSS